MDCTESQLLMAARIDSELDTPTQARLAEHLAACNSCAREFESLTQLSSDVPADATRYAAPPYLKRRVLAALPRKPAAVRMPARWPWFWINFGAALASRA